MLHSNRIPWKLSEKIQKGTTLSWRLDHAEALLNYRRPRRRSLWYLAWLSSDTSFEDGEFNNPSAIFEVARAESRAVTTMFMTKHVIHEAFAHQRSPLDTERHSWSPVEEDRISKLQVALSVTRAIYYAAIELDAMLTLTQIQRRWLTGKMIEASIERYAAFVDGLMIRERLSEGFIRKTLVFERDLHSKQVQRILVRRLSIAALSTGVSILERGQCVWFGPPSEAMAAFECFES